VEKKDVDSLKGMVKDKYTYYGTRDGERFLARAEEFKVEKKKSKSFTFSNRELIKILFFCNFFHILLPTLHVQL